MTLWSDEGRSIEQVAMGYWGGNKKGAIQQFKIHRAFVGCFFFVKWQIYGHFIIYNLFDDLYNGMDVKGTF